MDGISRAMCRPHRLAKSFVLVVLLSGCAERSCGNPYVLEFLDAADHRSSVAYLGLVGGSIRQDPGTTPDTERCAIWERVRNPAHGTVPNQPAVLLQPRYYSVTRIDDGWKVSP